MFKYPFIINLCLGFKRIKKGVNNFILLNQNGGNMQVLVAPIIQDFFFNYTFNLNMFCYFFIVEMKNLHVS